MVGRTMVFIGFLNQQDTTGPALGPSRHGLEAFLVHALAEDRVLGFLTAEKGLEPVGMVTPKNKLLPPSQVCITHLTMEQTMIIHDIHLIDHSQLCLLIYEAI